ncbi:MAG: tRNA (5-methylaminomethyl-2-thiouridine)(34)-methyltransferase MnmD [Putridiphycobacter sp.]
MQRKIITTKDNSKTLFIPEMDETYHSIHGALTEANHIFIHHGVDQFKNKPNVKVFEMGFGTGLNAILTYRYSSEQNLNINYKGIEKYPISQQELEDLNYSKLLNLTVKETEVLNQMHSQNFKSDRFNFTLSVDDIKQLPLPENEFDLIYFDAFAPNHQPDLWQPNILSKMYKSLVSGGFLITYCAQGQFKRDLKSVGFELVALPGPPGKREITKAIKN